MLSQRPEARGFGLIPSSIRLIHSDGTELNELVSHLSKMRVRITIQCFEVLTPAVSRLALKNHHLIVTLASCCVGAG
jgi:hypothetical protein